MNTPETSDEELARAVQEGDEEKFGILMDRYGARLFRYGRKFLSDIDNIDDAVQECFIKAYRNIQSFNPSQKFSPWIYRIAHNTFVDFLKRNSRQPIRLMDFDTFLSHTVAEDPVVKEREQKEMREIVDKGLGLLPPHYREVLVLYYLEDLDYKTIADILRIPIGTVGVRLRRGKEQLKNAYGELQIDIKDTQ